MLYFGRMRIVVFLSILLEVHLQKKENKIPQQANIPLPKEQTVTSKLYGIWFICIA